MFYLDNRPNEASSTINDHSNEGGKAESEFYLTFFNYPPDDVLRRRGYCDHFVAMYVCVCRWVRGWMCIVRIVQNWYFFQIFLAA